MNNKNKLNVEKLYSKINNNTHYIIFGLSTCIYCQKTIQLLKSKNIKYKFYIIENYYDLFFKTFLNLVHVYPDLDIIQTHKTVPIIFYKKKFIGGFSDLNNLIN